MAPLSSLGYTTVRYRLRQGVLSRYRRSRRAGRLALLLLMLTVGLITDARSLSAARTRREPVQRPLSTEKYAVCQISSRGRPAVYVVLPTTSLHGVT